MTRTFLFTLLVSATLLLTGCSVSPSVGLPSAHSILATAATSPDPRVTSSASRKTYLSISLHIDADGDGVITFGDSVYGDFGIAPSVHEDVNLWLRCTQGGVLVYEASYNRYAWPAQPIFQLGPTATWIAGGADCRASLETVARQPKTIAAVTVTVLP